MLGTLAPNKSRYKTSSCSSCWATPPSEASQLSRCLDGLLPRLLETRFWTAKSASHLSEFSKPIGNSWSSARVDNPLGAPPRVSTFECPAPESG